MVQDDTPLHLVCENENSEVLKLLLEAKLVDQDMLKNENEMVRVFHAVSDIFGSSQLSSTVRILHSENNYK